MHPHKHRLVRVYLAFNKSEMLVRINLVLVSDCQKLSGVLRRHRRLGHAPYEMVFPQTVFDYIGYGYNTYAVLLGKRLKLGHPRHGAVVFHYLAYNAHRRKSREPREVNRAFGLPRPDEHPALACAKREYVARTHEVNRLGVILSGREYGNRPVAC